jgi:hypothetical protein
MPMTATDSERSEMERAIIWRAEVSWAQHVPPRYTRGFPTKTVSSWNATRPYRAKTVRSWNATRPFRAKTVRSWNATRPFRAKTVRSWNATRPFRAAWNH